MSDHGGGSRHDRRRRGGGHEEAHADERWLLTYADMITLLMALFIVMWAISSVNVSKFAALRMSLREAFAGKLVSGGEGVLQGGKQVLQAEGARISSIEQPRQSPDPVASSTYTPATSPAPVGSAQAEVQSLQRLAQQIQSYARQHGLEKQIKASVDERGVVIRLLTDKVLFDAGSSDIKQAATPLISKVGRIIEKLEIANPIRVEGNTDSRPISTSRYHSNWELSTARATAVLQVLLATGMRGDRFSVAGYADQRPVASNSTDYGRYLNRHVDIVVLRHDGGTDSIASLR
jgi:chemotaxis protein MotB